MKKILSIVGVSLGLVFSAYAQEVQTHEHATTTQIEEHQPAKRQHVTVQQNERVQPQVQQHERESVTTVQENRHERGDEGRWFGNRWHARWHHREFHDRDWYVSHYSRVILINGCFYFYDDGCWWPAFGYQAGCNYPSDEPINCD